MILVQGLLSSLSGGAAVSSTRMKRLIPFSVLVVMLVGACASAEPAGTESTAAPAPSSTSTTTSTSTSIGSTEPDPVEEETVAEESLPDLGPADELRGIDGWLQADIESLDDLRGKVVVVQFWTFGCHNCKATLPNLEALSRCNKPAVYQSTVGAFQVLNKILSTNEKHLDLLSGNCRVLYLNIIS